MSDRADVRASDRDRQAAADRLRRAQEEGRLTLGEYDTRLAAAYRAVMCSDLAELFTDLPAPQPGPEPGVDTDRSVAPEPRTVAPPVRGRRQAPAMTAGPDTPAWLKVCWAVWLTVVLINLVVWGLVSVGNGEPNYFWPMWLAVPGAVLFGTSTAVTTLRRSRRRVPPPDANRP